LSKKSEREENGQLKNLCLRCQCKKFNIKSIERKKSSVKTKDLQNVKELVDHQPKFLNERSLQSCSPSLILTSMRPILNSRMPEENSKRLKPPNRRLMRKKRN
jgi:hypothetical protein